MHLDVSKYAISTFECSRDEEESKYQLMHKDCLEAALALGWKVIIKKRKPALLSMSATSIQHSAGNVSLL